MYPRGGRQHVVGVHRRNADQFANLGAPIWVPDRIPALSASTEAGSGVR